LGDVIKTNVTFAGGVSSPQYVTFNIAGKTPTTINKTTTDTWQWKAENIDGSGSDVCDFDVSGPHTVYTILDEPMPPWVNAFGNQRNAWVTALDFAIITCGAQGQEEIPAMASITQHLYDKHTYPADMEAKFWDEVLSMYLYTQYIASVPTSDANCFDSANGLFATFSVIGVGSIVKVQREMPPGASFSRHWFVKLTDGGNEYIYDCMPGPGAKIRMDKAAFDVIYPGGTDYDWPGGSIPIR
jgi:hypothetical protein